MQTIYLDARRLINKDEAHDYLKEQFSLPEYYGNNLDALYDCLTELPMTEIRIEHEEEASGYYAFMKPVFRNAQKENPDLVLVFSE